VYFVNSKRESPLSSFKNKIKLINEKKPLNLSSKIIQFFIEKNQNKPHEITIFKVIEKIAQIQTTKDMNLSMLPP